MGQIPRSIERISSAVYEMKLLNTKKRDSYVILLAHV